MHARDSQDALDAGGGDVFWLMRTSGAPWERSFVRILRPICLGRGHGDLVGRAWIEGISGWTSDEFGVDPALASAPRRRNMQVSPREEVLSMCNEYYLRRRREAEESRELWRDFTETRSVDDPEPREPQEPERAEEREEIASANR